jgi:hypothetical protein
MVFLFWGLMLIAVAGQFPFAEPFAHARGWFYLVMLGILGAMTIGFPH